MHKDNIVRKLIVWTPVVACVALGAYIVRPDRAPEAALSTEEFASTHFADDVVIDDRTSDASVDGAAEPSTANTTSTSTAPPTFAPSAPSVVSDQTNPAMSPNELAADEPRPLTEPPVQQFFAYDANPELAVQAHIAELSMRALRAPEVHVRRAAVSELAYTGNPEALDVLTQALRDFSPGVRFEAITSLRTLALAGGDADAILRALTNATYDSDANVVASAREGIAEVEQLIQ